MTTDTAAAAKNLDLTNIILTPHFKAQFKAKGFTLAQVREALANPYKVTEVRKYPGQVRFCGDGVNGLPGLAVIMDGQRAITAYLDGVVTPLRADQMNDADAVYSSRCNRAYA